MSRRIWMRRLGWPGFLSWRLRWCGGRRRRGRRRICLWGWPGLEAARRGETVFVVAEDSAPVPLLERVNDARRVGATILALDEGDPELDALAHEALAVPESLSFDAGQHLVSAAAGERDPGQARRADAACASGWPACSTR